METPVFGIDLGTTNSLIAACFGERVELIPNALGSVLTPSAVAVDDAGQVLVGQAALDRRFTHPQMAATVFKRLMGSSKRIRVGKREFSPEELSAFVLKSLAADAEAATGSPVREAVISVPAYFNDTQRKATTVAAQLAGISVKRLVNEPTAAALAFGIHRAKEESTFLVFDLGGGTFDVSIVEMFDDVVEVKASTGDNYLGGEDFNAQIAKDMCKVLKIAHEDEVNFATRLNHAAEQIKRQLSGGREGSINIALPSATEDAAALVYSITEERFIEICEPLMGRLRKPIERALRDSRIKPNALNDIVLVGGSTRMPIVRKMVARMFGRFPNIEQQPDHAIANGAATLAALLSGGRAFNEALMTDVCPYSLGVETCVHSASGEYIDGIFTPVIERNTLVPASRSKVFSPLSETQQVLQLDVYQGEHRSVRDNILLGSLEIKLPSMSMLSQQSRDVEVRFTYDASGLLEVEATVLSTGKMKALTLTSNNVSLTEEHIAQIKKAFDAVKIHPRDELPNAAALARADRAYAESMGRLREAIGDAITAFNAVLAEQDRELAARHRVKLERWLDEVEARTTMFPPDQE
jgi:molecular chaperone HscC